MSFDVKIMENGEIRRDYQEGRDWTKGMSLGTGAYSTCYQVRTEKTRKITNRNNLRPFMDKRCDRYLIQMQIVLEHQPAAPGINLNLSQLDVKAPT